MIQDPTTHFNQKSFFLKRLEETLLLNISRKQIEQLTLYIEDDYRKFFVDEIAIRITREFFGDKVEKEISLDFEYPATWWQHFKRSHFPKWLLKKFPVKKKTISKSKSLRRTFEYPELIDHFDLSRDEYIIREFVNPIS